MSRHTQLGTSHRDSRLLQIRQQLSFPNPALTNMPVKLATPSANSSFRMRRHVSDLISSSPASKRAKRKLQKGQLKNGKGERCTPPPPVIDCEAFPHIMETIIRCAPRASLIALRNTSKHFKDLSDIALARHMRLDCEGIRHAEGKHPAMMSSNDILKHTEILDVKGRSLNPTPAMLKPWYARVAANCWPMVYRPHTVYIEDSSLVVMSYLEGVRRMIINDKGLWAGLRLPCSLSELVILVTPDVEKVAATVIAKHVANNAVDGVNRVKMVVVIVAAERAKSTEQNMRRNVERYIVKYGPDLDISSRWTGSATWTFEEIKTVANELEFTTLDQMEGEWWRE